MTESENYCTSCIFRMERVYRNNKGEIDFSQIERKPIVTNKNNFCYIGYKQNPMTLEATENALRNNALLCPRNPFLKGKPVKEAHHD